MAWDTKYGVNTLIKEVHVNAVDFDETFRKPEYRYIVEIVHIHDHNGNGEKSMKIYTDGELIPFNVGNWKISPIIRMPYNWTGFGAEIEMSDLNAKVYIKKGTPDVASQFGKKDFIPDIKWVFESIKSMENIENVEHIEILELISEINRILNIYKSKSVDAEAFQKHFDSLKNLNDKRKGIKDALSEINSSILTIKINESIELFNTISLNIIR